MAIATLKFFIVEDEPLAQQKLREAIVALPNNHVCGVAADVATAYEGILQHAPDAIFLDIKLKGGDAFDLLELLQKNKIDFPPVILMTAYTEFEFAQKALNDFRIKILRILRKPFMEDFEQKFTECRSAILAYSQTYQQRHSFNQILTVKQGNITYRIYWKDVVYVEVGGSGSIILVTKEAGNIQIPQTLSHFMDSAPTSILRIHRNNAVNIDLISHIDHENRLVFLKGNNKGLSIGRTYYPAVMNLII